MTIQDIKTKPSYEPLKSNGFTDSQIVIYYTLPITERKTFFNRIKNGESAIITPSKPSEVVTQKCTKLSILRMANEYMDKDFEVRGKTYNMRGMGWSFRTNTRKRAFGICKYGRGGKFIELSEWLILNTDKSFNDWVDTMLHEIAHAIDVEIRGRSSHDNHWRGIALTIGCNGKRCGTAKYTEEGKAASKYTLVCPNGHTQPSHKKSRLVAQGRSACGKCCKELNGGRFSKEYVWKQIQNY